jgi:four helix bundle protein
MGRLQGGLPERSLRFAVTIVSLADHLPANNKGWPLGRQLIRGGTSIGAKVSEADRAQTRREFIQRCSIARKEAAECDDGLRLCRQVGALNDAVVDAAAREADELIRILGAFVKRSQARRPDSSN